MVRVVICALSAGPASSEYLTARIRMPGCGRGNGADRSGKAEQPRTRLAFRGPAQFAFPARPAHVVCSTLLDLLSMNLSKYEARGGGREATQEVDACRRRKQRRRRAQSKASTNPHKEAVFVHCSNAKQGRDCRLLGQPPTARVVSKQAHAAD